MQLHYDPARIWMWHRGAWFSGHGGDRLMIGLDDLGGSFQPCRFYDSVTECDYDELMFGFVDPRAHRIIESQVFSNLTDSMTSCVK